MDIQIGELTRLKNSLDKIIEENSSCFTKSVVSLRNIENIIQSDGLNKSINSLVNEIEAIQLKLGRSCQSLSSFLGTQMQSYATSNEEAKLALDKLIEALTGKSGESSYSSSYTPNSEERSIVIPNGMGGQFTHMKWQAITAKSSNQYKLREAYGMNFDEQGIGVIDGKWVVATTTTFGNVGDTLKVEMSNGQTFDAVIGDIKSQGDAGCNQYGHNNGHSVIEFVVDGNAGWWGYNGGTKSFFDAYPEYKGSRVVKVTNTGHYDF